MRKKMIIAYFKVESNRDCIEGFIMNNTFKDIEDLKEQSRLVDLEFDGWCTIEEFMINVNSEFYPTENWVANCYVEQI
jgi:hypothetical protein